MCGCDAPRVERKNCSNALKIVAWSPALAKSLQSAALRRATRTRNSSFRRGGDDGQSEIVQMNETHFSEPCNDSAIVDRWVCSRSQFSSALFPPLRLRASRRSVPIYFLFSRAFRYYRRARYLPASTVGCRCVLERSDDEREAERKA